MSSASLADTDQLADRLHYVMDADQLREAAGTLDDLSDEARYFGSPNWETPADAPRQVINLVLKAAVRHMKNYEGYVTSRAGDETVAWADLRREETGSATFSKEERERLAEWAGRSGSAIYSVGMYGYTNRPARRVGYIPGEGGGEKLLYYASDTEPW